MISLAITSSSSHSPFSIADLAATDKDVSFWDSANRTESFEICTNPYNFEKWFAIFSFPLTGGPIIARLGGLYAILSLGYISIIFLIFI